MKIRVSGVPYEVEMLDLRKAAEMALEVMEYNRANGTPNMGAAIEALRQALARQEQEPVAWVYNGILHEFDPSEFATSEVKPLYTAPPISDYHEGWEEGFKAATREQEPFIYVREDNEKPFGGFEHCSEADAGAFPVYTAPPKREWVGLTDEEIEECKINGGLPHAINWRLSVKVMEAKLKEKNT